MGSLELTVYSLGFRFTVNAKNLETGLRTNSAGIPYTLLLRTEAMGFPTFGLLLYMRLRTLRDTLFLCLRLSRFVDKRMSGSRALPGP